MTDRSTLVRLLSQRSVRRGRFTLASGRESSHYVDARLTTMSPEGLAVIGPLALEAIRERAWPADAVGGLTLGADPIAYATALASVFGVSLRPHPGVVRLCRSSVADDPNKARSRCSSTSGLLPAYRC